MRTTTRIEIEDISIDVTFKRMRNLRLSIHPPGAQVRISAPRRTSMAELRGFALSKLDWIRRHRLALLAVPPAPRPAYVGGEVLPLWGRELPLLVVESGPRQGLSIEGDALVLRVRPDSDAEARQKLVDAWYKARLLEALPPLLEAWQTRLGVRVAKLSVRRMKTKWGSCHPGGARIGLNSDLAKRDPELLEYVLVHELVHLFVPNHGPRFVARMDALLPGWRGLRRRLDGRNPSSD